jgi:hypothetical protein
MQKCTATPGDCGHAHHDKCYCHEDQGAGYTYQDEYGDCDFCLGLFQTGQVICADESNSQRICPDSIPQ